MQGVPKIVSPRRDRGPHQRLRDVALPALWKNHALGTQGNPSRAMGRGSFVMQGNARIDTLVEAVPTETQMP